MLMQGDFQFGGQHEDPLSLELSSKRLHKFLIRSSSRPTPSPEVGVKIPVLPRAVDRVVLVGGAVVNFVIRPKPKDAN
jgi:hypothetical protein